ncbi:MAG: MBL fold metallo-hydrolase [Clostridia bacterium]|nr:MBL fold metallo-hydrolase [Clostridia bacterium]
MNKIEVIYVGDESYPTNCYIIYDEDKNGVLIDPGFEGEKIIEKIKELSVDVKKIVLTHCHIDHFSVVDMVKDYTKAEVMIHENDRGGIDDTNKACFFHFPDIVKPKLTSNDVTPLKDGDKITVRRYCT